MNRSIAIPVIIAVLLGLGLLYMSFQRVTEAFIDRTESYYYESDEAFGTSILAGILEEVYGEDKVVPLSETGALTISSKNKNKGYFIISDYLFYDVTELDSLREFIRAGNHAMFLASSASYELDSTLLHNLLWEESDSDSILHLSIAQTDNVYDLNCHLDQLDTLESRY